MKILCVLLGCLLTITSAFASSKPHVVSFGKWQPVKWYPAEESQALELRMRPLLVDGKLKEYTTGLPHDVTERVFVVSRVVRLNDALPGEKQPRWIWTPGGWLLVDRTSGRISPLRLPDLDPVRDGPAWYRDYAAYCGAARDGRVYAIIMQLGGRKPVLRKRVEPAAASGRIPDCLAATWQRQPTHVDFGLDDGSKFTFTLKTGSLELPQQTRMTLPSR